MRAAFRAAPEKFIINLYKRLLINNYDNSVNWYGLQIMYPLCAHYVSIMGPYQKISFSDPCRSFQIGNTLETEILVLPFKKCVYIITLYLLNAHNKSFRISGPPSLILTHGLISPKSLVFGQLSHSWTEVLWLICDLWSKATKITTHKISKGRLTSHF